MIPKIIHYCWLSGDPVPKEYRKRMRSWKKKIPDYEFVLWDAKRFDTNSSQWVKDTLAIKRYASAADYIRIFAVYHFGGIYLDMDMEVVKRFDNLLDTDLLLAKENHISDTIEAGCFGAVKGHPYLKMCLDWMDARPFSRSLPLMPGIMLEVLEGYDRSLVQKLLPSDYFTAKNIENGLVQKTKNTYAVHHFATNWCTKGDRVERAAGRLLCIVFGKNKLSDTLFELIKKIRTVCRRLRNDGMAKPLVYYAKKYLFKHESVPKLG